MYTSIQKLTDGSLAYLSAMSTTQLVNSDPLPAPVGGSVLMQLALPIITGFLVPFLKDLTLKVRAKRRAKRGLN